MRQKEITRGSVATAVAAMIIANIIWATMISHDWQAAYERSFFQLTLGLVIIYV
jgi:hypothetical protein